MAELSRTHDQNESTPAFTVKIRSIFSRLDSFTLGDDPSITHLEAQPRAAAHAEEPLDRGWLTALNELFEFDVHNPWLWSQINLVLLPAVRLFFGGAWKRYIGAC